LIHNYISKKLAKLMNGFVSVTSAVGEGSTFSFGVQCGSITHPSTTTTTTTAPTTPTTITTTPPMTMTTTLFLRDTDNKRVLIVEDNAMNQTLLARLFTLKGELQSTQHTQVINEYSIEYSIN
jgi:hypothetical protein